MGALRLAMVSPGLTGLEVLVDIAMQSPRVSSNVDPVAVARYIAALDAERPEPDVTQLKLQKLMYFVQANALASMGRRLFDADVEAYRNGPVVTPVLGALYGLEREIIASKRPEWPSRDVGLPDDAKAFIEAVWDRYKGYSASRLWEITHAQDPWRDHYVDGVSHIKIPDAEMAEYFRSKVPASKRVFHEDVVVIDEKAMEELFREDDDALAGFVAAFR